MKNFLIKILSNRIRPWLSKLNLFVIIDWWQGEEKKKGVEGWVNWAHFQVNLGNFRFLQIKFNKFWFWWTFFLNQVIRMLSCWPMGFGSGKMKSELPGRQEMPGRSAWRNFSVFIWNWSKIADFFGHFQANLGHGSLEAILSRTKFSKKTKIGDGSETPGTSVPNKFLSALTPSEFFFRKFVFFQRLSTSRLFWYIFRGQVSFTWSPKLFAETYITFLKGYDADFPKKSKLSINFCFEILDC
jgi:hypothetical protein